MIRKVRPEDAKRIAEIYSWYVANTTITYEITLPDEAEMLRRIKKISAQFPWLVYEKKTAKLLAMLMPASSGRGKHSISPLNYPRISIRHTVAVGVAWRL